MPAIALAVALVIPGGPVFAAGALTKKAGESDAVFVARVTKHELATSGNMVDSGPPQLASTPVLIKGATALVAFTEVPEPGDPDDNDINLNAFIKQSDLSYARIGETEACEVEGGSPSMRTFFFADLGGGSQPVVGVICGWDASHAAADCQANDEVRFFNVDAKSVSAIDMKKYDALFYKQEKPSKKATYTCAVSKFATAQDVKRLLKGGR
jgi:hypothetical protein